MEETITVPPLAVEEKDEDDFFSEEPVAPATSDATTQRKHIEFEFFDSSKTNGICSYKKSVADNVNKQSIKVIKVGKNSGSPAHFFIKAKKSGPMKVKIRAEVSKNGRVMIYDEVERTLKVEHEGLTEYSNQPILIDLRGKEADNFVFQPNIETEFKNSIRNHVSLVGNMMGPAIMNTEKLM